MALQIGILDDESIWLTHTDRTIKNMAENLEIEIDTCCFSHGKELKSYQGTAFDALFLDIELDGEEDGIEIAKWVNFNWPECQVIFLTNYHSFIMDSYNAEHYFYLLKSKMEAYLPELLRKIQIHTASKVARYAFRIIGNETQFVLISSSEILYFERNRRRTRIVCKEQEYETWEKIGDIYDRIEHRSFLRCHNSYIVHIPEIRQISRDEVQMSDGTFIKISRAYRSIAADAFIRWAGEQML